MVNWRQSYRTVITKIAERIHILYRSFQVKRYKRGLFPTRTSSIFLKIGILGGFSKNQTSIFYSGQKASHKKNYRVTNFSIFHDFSIILSLITQRVFIPKTCAWVRWNGILLSKIQNIEKTINNIFFSKKLLVSMT
jgi:hypothetical protein